MPRKPFDHFVKYYRSHEFQPAPEGDHNLVQENLVLVVDYGEIAHVLQRLAKEKIYCGRTTGTFPRTQLSIRRFKVTPMIFFSGSTVFVGGKRAALTLYNALVLRLILEEIRSQFFPEISSEKLIFGRPKNANLVFSGSLDGDFYDIAAFAASTNGAAYEPLRFPGANWKIRSPTGLPLCQVMVFEKGKFNMMGGRTVEDTKYALKKFINRIEKFRCERKAPTDDIIQTRDAEKEYAAKEVMAAMMNFPDSIFAKTLTPIVQSVDGRKIKDIVATGEDIMVM